MNYVKFIKTDYAFIQLGLKLCRNMASSSAVEISLKDVQEAAKRIEPHIHRTPVMTSSTLDGMAGRALHFKCEIFQKIGAFKVSMYS